MSPTDTSEQGLESLIVASLVGEAGYAEGASKDYDKEYAIDTAKLMQFLTATQPDTFEQLGIGVEGTKRDKFLHRLREEITKRGVLDVLRKGVKHGSADVALFYGSPTPGNRDAEQRFAANIFSVTRQLHYSKTKEALALDLGIFVNGLPVATFELKNRLTKQTVDDAVRQYQLDRLPTDDLLFRHLRCVAHFAVDDHEVRFCTHLNGKRSSFLPFNKGRNDGAGNPPNPRGLATDYLWKQTLTKASLTNILEKYAQVVKEENARSTRKQPKQIFPRYHQLDVVQKLLADVAESGSGKRYLIQHSAGSGKSNSIAWLAHQLVDLQHKGKVLFDSIIVVTDRKVLDRQIHDTIQQFAQVSSTVGRAEDSGDLRKMLKSGKKIIISTVQKFPHILGEMEDLPGSQFAIIIDEAHSSQGGRTSAAMNEILDSDRRPANKDETTEDKINKIMQGRKMVENASYFAFTATPKAKTLELFGASDPQADGKVPHRPFHSYTMKQAIDEGFILDVVRHYTPVLSYYQLIKAVPDDPEFDSKKAQKKLRRYVESHTHAIGQKARVMVDHFHASVQRKIGSKARAMVVTSGVDNAIEYFHAIKACLEERKSPHRAIVAFSGDKEYSGKTVTEATLNGFPSSEIESKMREDDLYRFLVVAEKYQTGYDEPLLHTMYVDKMLTGIRAVQTLSRLNRARPGKHDTFVLDFVNETSAIREAFEPYYRTTILSDETDPNRLHDLKATLDGYQVYAPQDVEDFVARYLHGAGRVTLDPILDQCVAVYISDLDEDGQVDFKGKAKAFGRAYNFLGSILPYSNPDWERLSIFLNFLVPKLPAPREDDLSRGILDAIDMESYRVEVQDRMSIGLADGDAEIDPVPVEGGGSKPDPDMAPLSAIIEQFNQLFGDIAWQDADQIRKVITEDIPAKVAEDKAYQNAIKNNDKANAKIEHERALKKVMQGFLENQLELFKQYTDNESFNKWLHNTIFGLTYQPPSSHSNSLRGAENIGKRD